jgi:hypothetical protein
LDYREPRVEVLLIDLSISLHQLLGLRPVARKGTSVNWNDCRESTSATSCHAVFGWLCRVLCRRAAGWLQLARDIVVTLMLRSLDRSRRGHDALPERRNLRSRMKPSPS